MTIPPGIGTAYRILRDDQFSFRTISDRADIEVRATVTVMYDDGGIATFPLQATTVASSNSGDDTTGMAKDGWVIAANVQSTGTVGRGELWCAIRYGSTAVFANNRNWVCQGYVYSEHNLTLGLYDDMVGPTGSGYINQRIVANDVAPVDIQTTLAVSNTIRRVRGFIWFYHCSSDVANRTLRASVRDLGVGLPTGMTSGGNTLSQLWPSAAVVTLTANQEGMIMVKDQFAVSLDNGTATWEDPSARPNPFPYWVQDTDVGEFFFDVTDEEAADRHSIYIIEESWVRIR